MYKELIGKIISFESVTQHQAIEAKLLYVSADYIQVELKRDIHSENSLWYAGSKHIFNIDKIFDVQEIEKWMRPEKKRDAHIGRPRSSRKFDPERKRVQDNKNQLF